MGRPFTFRRLRACPPRQAAGFAIAPVAAIALAGSLLVPSAVASQGDERLVFRPPVDRPVTDPFRPPADPYGSGNRGVEYDTDPGDVVRAAAAGTVVFSGAVAGSLHVTVDHAGGVVSSYSHLLRISVRGGAEVAQGQVIAIAGDRLHFGVRVDGNYVDPFGFIGVRRIRVRLVSAGPWSRHH
jgi:murein DD-endopeptidase MepM/ murein hydrolase activator NlpD